MYIFNMLTVKPKLPERIKELETIAGNLWWTWNVDFIRLFKEIDKDLWDRCKKSPVKFLKKVSQEKLDEAVLNDKFLESYDTVVKNFYAYMDSKETYFNRNFPDNTNDKIAYFSAEYGLDETIPIYSGGLRCIIR